MNPTSPLFKVFEYVASVCGAAAALQPLLILFNRNTEEKRTQLDKISMFLFHSTRRMSLKPFKYLILENIRIPLTLEWHKVLFVTEGLLWIWARCAE